MLCWVALLTGGVWLAARRTRTGRAWGLFGLYCLGAYLLVVVTRATVIGGIVGLEYRYLADVLPVFVLALALSSVELRGAAQPSVAREHPRAPLPPARVAAGLAVAVALSGILSSATYARIWHDQHAARDYFDRVRASLGGEDSVDVAADPAGVPAKVVTPLVAPWHLMPFVLPLAGLDVDFPDVTSRLVMVDDDGSAHTALVDRRAVSTREGRGCGTLVNREESFPLYADPGEDEWWARVGYLASEADTVRVRAGLAAADVPVHKGVGSIWIRVADPISQVVLEAPAGAAALCVSEVEVGPLVPGAPL